MDDTLNKGLPGMVNASIPARLSKAWARRAATIEAKAQALLGDMLLAVGGDDPLTDHADNIVNEAADIGDLLARGQALQAGEKS